MVKGSVDIVSYPGTATVTVDPGYKLIWVDVVATENLAVHTIYDVRNNTCIAYRISPAQEAFTSGPNCGTIIDTTNTSFIIRTWWDTSTAFTYAVVY